MRNVETKKTVWDTRRKEHTQAGRQGGRNEKIKE